MSSTIHDHVFVEVSGSDERQLQQHPSRDVAEMSPACNEEEDAHSIPIPGFLDWTTFDEATLPPRKNARRSRLDRILSPLKSVNAGLPGSVSVDGLGGVIESAHGVFHSVRRLDFMESERAIYLMPEDGAPRSDSLPRRELERYENELFDLSKYDGPCAYLTAMTWTEETLAGSITLFEVLFGNAGETVALRPVAAMRDVPSSVLIKMRTDERIRRKAVLTPTDEDDRTLDTLATPRTRFCPWCTEVHDMHIPETKNSTSCMLIVQVPENEKLIYYPILVFNNDLTRLIHAEMITHGIPFYRLYADSVGHDMMFLPALVEENTSQA
ncbi:hypothetical protein NEMBOFW57_009298 [Staphylotrichum longicolle]|uniref:Uncharacterized protein n=1 Tax=Staphylotrichum longicolle TaxID=669026 RepID=A0AAD4HTC3_9PEZI|nr:hypothetical protein NEMBOFW57_009298 [Staphylotrichum longicolle]